MRLHHFDLGSVRHRSVDLALVGTENVDLFFMTAIVGIAVRFGLWPSLYRQRDRLVSCYNFFFMQPLYTFTIADPTNVGASPFSS